MTICWSKAYIYHRGPGMVSCRIWQLTLKIPEVCLTSFETFVSNNNCFVLKKLIAWCSFGLQKIITNKKRAIIISALSESWVGFFNVFCVCYLMFQLAVCCVADSSVPLYSVNPEEKLALSTCFFLYPMSLLVIYLVRGGLCSVSAKWPWEDMPEWYLLWIHSEYTEFFFALAWISWWVVLSSPMAS